jgi:hypothetical protein
MTNVRNDVIGGFNTFRQEQLDLEGECLMTLVQFDSVYEVLHDLVPLAEVPPRDTRNFVPRGATALLDALGQALSSTREKIEAMDEVERPGLVVTIIFTDGWENSSVEWGLAKVRKLITDSETELGWQTIYLGANVDAFAEADNLGIRSSSAAGFSADSKGSRAAYAGTSAYVGRMRGATSRGGKGALEAEASRGFSADERGAMKSSTGR